MPDLVCVGELLIDFVSSAADVPLSEAPGFLKAPGGAPANVAVAAARLGLASAFIGKVGADPFGEFLRGVLEREGVDCSSLIQDCSARTTLAFVATRTDGRKDIAFYRHPGADMLLSSSDLPRAVLSGARCVHFGSVSLTREPARSATLEAIKIARDGGAFISYDPNLRLPLWDNDLDTAREMIWRGMALADVVKLADEEWEFITGETDFEKGAARILKAGPGLCLVTLGERGAYYDDGFRRGAVTGYRVETGGADTLGAGDAFVGAVLTRLLINRLRDSAEPRSFRSVDLDDLARYGNAAGAIACTVPGAIPSLPTLDALNEFRRKNDPLATTDTE